MLKLFNGNTLTSIISSQKHEIDNRFSLYFQEEGLSEVQLHLEDLTCEKLLKTTLEELSINCNRYVSISKSSVTGPGVGKTKLDKERTKLCQRELENIGIMSRNLKALVTKSSFKERLKTAQSYLQKLKFLVEDVSSRHSNTYIHVSRNKTSNLLFTAARFLAGCFHLGNQFR